MNIDTVRSGLTSAVCAAAAAQRSGHDIQLNEAGRARDLPAQHGSVLNSALNSALIASLLFERLLLFQETR